MDGDRSPAPPPVRPVAYVSQLGTSFVDPVQTSSASTAHTSRVATSSQEFSAQNPTTLPSHPLPSHPLPEEAGQGDAGRHSSPSSLSSLTHAPEGSHPEDVVDDDLLGAVGGAPPPRPERPSSRIPTLNMPHFDPSLLSEPLRPQFDLDRPLSPPVPVAEVEDQANLIIQGFFDERFRQESRVAGNDAADSGVLVMPRASTVGQAPPVFVMPEDTVSDEPDVNNVAASMLHPDAARRAAGFSSSSSSPSSLRVEPDKIKAVSSKLCLIAAEMDQRYSVEFDEMIDFMKLDGSSAYAAFSQVANHFLSGKITWGKVITLLALGYRMARRVIDLAIPNFVQDIIAYLTKFVCRHLAKWIADRGGWLAILNLEEGISWAGMFGIMSIGCAVLAALSWLKQR